MRVAPLRSFATHLVTAFALWLGSFAPAFALDMGQMAGDVWGSGNRNLVVILHGDGGPGRYDSYAKALASAAKGTTVVTLVRPGFRGSAGRSKGTNSGKDHYTSRNNKLLAASLAAMKNDLRPQRMIVVGHSGGAGQLGTVIATAPGIVDVAVLVSCPCNVPRWRIHRRGKNNWTASQSPHKYAKKVSRNTKVVAITGANDPNTRPHLAEEYVTLARSAGVNASLSVPKGVNHKWSSLVRHVDAAIRKNLR
ncbi:alpha/beta hydrolase family protein [Thalassococcus lentus]|uniref:Alpha/beta hydrolase n=1 Tax=Thalassococcus lentus TaxID=1210524 RepID=A0ABT4XWX3_9RHOB|nr:alpha/beta hydrolase [Thalassococcus lentus]MDA7426475.1 alpha/beta hydrolase [Thalassococcus lentus]